MMVPKEDFVEEVQRAVKFRKDVTGEAVEAVMMQLFDAGLMDDRAVRNYVITQRFWRMRKDPANAERSNGDIYLDLSAYSGLSVESVWRIVHRGRNS